MNAYDALIAALDKGLTPAQVAADEGVRISALERRASRAGDTVLAARLHDAVVASGEARTDQDTCPDCGGLKIRASRRCADCTGNRREQVRLTGARLHQAGPRVTDWTEHAACAGRYQLFDLADEQCRARWDSMREPEQVIATQIIDAAVTVCQSCPVRDACLADTTAIEGNEKPHNRYSVRGGLTPKERAARQEPAA